MFAVLNNRCNFVTTNKGTELFKLQKIKIMTTENFKTIAVQKLNTLSTTDLIVAVKELSNNFTESAEYVFDVCLDILMKRLPENDFVELCDSL
jgi:hypothetical protein